MEETRVKCDVCDAVMPQGHGMPIAVVEMNAVNSPDRPLRRLELRVTFEDPTQGQDICDDCAKTAARMFAPLPKKAKSE